MKKILILIVCTVFVTGVFTVSAQPPPPPPPGPLSGTAAPIDTDAFILLIITTTFGIYKIYKRKNHSIKATL